MEKVRSLSMEELESQKVELLPDREEMHLGDLAGVGNVASNTLNISVVSDGPVNVDANQLAIAGSFNLA